ncbi:aromatic ring-hydroxylating dioxygenase subunit alpha [Delftia sp. ASV31]|uniref:aromatic ring-hydroxylating oxygenase subunit alpha n=1 Tax=Delftia sp. ASV31 TaxID=2795113 RepID=UPI0018EC3328|nr:aromatic ring-hydroxylating dioxygenase subunit alpha [Delftia sp. ASV31]
MYPGLSQLDYIDDGVFAQEQSRIFRKLWIFAGLRTLLDKPDSFLTRQIGGVPVVVQNFDGAIKAFRNQCAHRQAPLQMEEYGCRRLVCRYHGWSYDNTGHVHGLPGEHRLYHYGDARREQLCLDEFAVRCIGNLLFVNLDADPLPIEQQFGPALLQSLADSSGHLCGQAIHCAMPAAYNWKLNFENVLDYNHVPFVHPQSFRPLMEKGALHELSVALEADPSQEFDLQELSFLRETPLKLPRSAWHGSVDRFGDKDVYYNYFLYPNTNFISVGGYFFLIQQFDPVAPARTDVRFTLATARPHQRMAAMPAILWEHMKIEKRVLDEDRVILETLQRGLHAAGPVARHGAYEVQLHRVAMAYRQLMGRSQ